MEIHRRGDFQITFFTWNEPDFLALQFKELNVVGNLIQWDRAPLKRVEQIGATHDLWRLHRPELVAGDGALNFGGERAGGLFDRK